ncbi:MAG: DegT/DnrJ/EryC1/StrS family aminotransferase [Vicingaceae bacterium]
MIPFSPPDIYPEIIEEVIDTLNSGWITTGPKTKRFEKEITAYTGAKSTLCVNSATAGLELALRWFDIGPGDEVIVPAYTYCSSANVVLHCGATVVMTDVKEDFNIDVLDVERKIGPRTKAIIPVDFAGFPADLDELKALVERPDIRKMFKAKGDVQGGHGRILILSDAAHSFGAIYKGRRAGVNADISVFSFHAVKNLTTAEGGALCFNLTNFDNEEVYRKLVIKSLHGQNKDALAKTRIGGWKYDVVEAGYKWNMTDIQASMGLVALKNYDSRTLKRREEIFNAYREKLSVHDWAQIPVYSNEIKTSSYHLFPLRIKGIDEPQRDAIITGIFERHVSVNVHFPILPLLSVYRDLGYKAGDYPVAMDNYSREISLPVYYQLSDEQVDEVVNAVIQSVIEVLN